MTSKKNQPEPTDLLVETTAALPAGALRPGSMQAGEIVRGKTDKTAESPHDPETMSPEATRRILLELQVHQIELEIQNEELLRAQMELDAARKRYSNLYDSAPVGYVTISEQGHILETNLTAATLLGVARDALVNQPLCRFIFKDDQDIHYLHRKQLLESGRPQVCDLRLVKKDATVFWARLQAAAAHDSVGTPVFRVVLTDITAHKQAEQQESEASKREQEVVQEQCRRLESIIAGTQLGIWEWNIQTGAIVFNDRWAEIIGYRRNELLPSDIKTWKTFAHPDDLQRSTELLERHFAGALPHYECKCRIKHKDGRWIWALDRGRVITRTRDGKPLMMYVTRTDITERKRTEEALKDSHDQLERLVRKRTADLCALNEYLRREMEGRRRVEVILSENEERYQRITEGLTDYLYTVHIRDGTAVATTRSPACKRVTGYIPEEYAADPSLWIGIVVPEDRNLVVEHIQKTLTGEDGPPVEYRIRHKDGQIRWVSDKLIKQLDSLGKLVRYDGVIKDITKRKQAEEELFNSEATLAMAIDGISDPIIMLDAELRVKRLNRAAKNYYGLTSGEETIGKFCFHAFHGKSSPCAGCERPFSAMQGYSGSHERKGAMNPDRLEQVVVDVARDASGKPEASIVRIYDITQARMMDRQLIQSEKLASLGLLIAGIAHEINNPNNFIYFNTPILRSYLQFLLPIVDEYVVAHPGLQFFNRPYAVFREDCFKLLDNIEHGSTRINQIVGNLREFVRERGQGERRWIDLKQVVEKSISICLGRIRKTVKTFEANISEELPPLFTDPLAIEQVVVNLLINAIQAADKDDSWVKLHIIRPSEPEGEMIVEVSDNGCGMDTEIQKKIFDPFFTTKAVGVGTGLGLSISYRLVEELGGSIKVKSEVGKGSSFRIILKTTQH